MRKSAASQEQKLSGRESNPGHPRDRRVYLPLYYQRTVLFHESPLAVGVDWSIRNAREQSASAFFLRRFDEFASEPTRSRSRPVRASGSRVGGRYGLCRLSSRAND
jgi:hypothetical protein